MLQKKLNLNLASLVTMNFGTESDAGAAEQELLLAIRSKITTKSRAKAIFVVAPSEQAPSKKIINLTGGGRISIFYEPWLSVSEAKLLFDRREIHAYAPAYKVRDRSGFSHRRQEQFLSSYLWSKVTHPVSSEPVPPIILDKLFPWVEANCPDFRGLERPGYSSERGQLGILVNYYDQGDYICAHSDEISELACPTIVSFSFGEFTKKTMRMRQKRPSSDAPEKYDLELAHNVCVVMENEAVQRLFTHQVTALGTGWRVNVTFRLHKRV